MTYDETWREIVGKEKDSEEKKVSFNDILNSCIKPCVIVFSIIFTILLVGFKIFEYGEIVKSFLLNVHSCFVFSTEDFYIPVVTNAIFIFFAILLMCIRSNYYKKFNKSEKVKFTIVFSVTLLLNMLSQYALFASFWSEESREYMSDIMIGISNISHFSTWAVCIFVILSVLASLQYSNHR